jgi:beta-glucosidase
MPILPFPAGFLWGAATSAPQIEGAIHEGGRGESIWDRFAATPGKIVDGSTPAIACDHYHRWREDVAILRDLGVGAYRFSIAWPRIVPTAGGGINAAGLDFYDALVDALLTAGIQPWVTLYHWDLPQWLQDRGGWAARETAHTFVDYAGAVATRLGDRAKHWMTHNEPWCIAHLGHEAGEHAPGHTDPAESLRVAHHVLLSHGWALAELRRSVPSAEVGIVLNLTPADPATPSVADLEATRDFDGFFNRWYLDPVFHGRYPEDAIADRVRRGHLPAGPLPFVEPGDLAAISAPIDFLGINYYTRAVVRAGGDGERVAVEMGPAESRTAMGWEIRPQSLHELLVRVQREYRPARIYLTENGAAFADSRDPDGAVHDPRRIDYLRGHLLACQRAIADGVALRGYFAWSLLDNFEWAQGYAKRFGLYWVDYATQERTAKASARWYRDVVRGNAVVAAAVGDGR